MRQTIVLLAVAVLCAGPVAAHEAPHAVPNLQGLQAAAPMIQSPLEARRLYYPLTREQTFLAPKTLEFRFRVEGNPYLTETLALPRIPRGKTSSFELLAEMRPALENLYTLEERPGRVMIQVLLDGREIQKLSFHELTLSTLDVRRPLGVLREARSTIQAFVAGALPRPADANGVKLTAAAGLDPACVSACQSQFYSCANSQCGGPNCPQCDADYQYCLSTCPCTEPKSTYSTQSTTTQHENLGSGCLYTPSAGHAHSYLQYRERNKTTTWITTEACNGTTTLTEGSSTYSPWVTCYTNTNSHCSPDQGTFAGCHY